jgi:putative sterol carrier protein
MTALLRRAADWFARAVRSLSTRTRALLVRGPAGRLVVATIFAGMRSQFDAGRAGDLEAVVRWDVTDDRPRDLVIRDGRCRVVRRAERDPQLTFALDRLGLLELATGVTNGPQMYFSGRLRINGDLMLAQRLTALFAIPGSARG